jgi:hypothetical protein
MPRRLSLAELTVWSCSARHGERLGYGVQTDISTVHWCPSARPTMSANMMRTSRKMSGRSATKLSREHMASWGTPAGEADTYVPAISRKPPPRAPDGQ